LLFVTKKLADGKPFKRFLEFALVRGDHASKRRRELRAHCDFALALVGEIEKLLDDFGAALFLVKISGLKKRSVPFEEAITTSDFAPARKDVISRGAGVGQEIAKTW